MLWNACCLEHDIAYWLGGSRTDRLRADEALHECLNKYDLPVSAFLVKKTVRVTGSAYLPFPFRWGYGWPFPRGYRSPDPDARIRAAFLLEEAGYAVPDWLLIPSSPAETGE